MADFKKIDKMIEMIENNIIPEEMTFNEFSIDFFENVKLIPLSKYLRQTNHTKRLPKIMNMKKAGEILTDTLKNDEIIAYIKRKTKQNQILELNYSSIMLLRKIDLKSNWDRIIMFDQGNESVEKINSMLRPNLLPKEIETLENFLKEELKINDKELDWLLSKTRKIFLNKEILKSIKRLSK